MILSGQKIITETKAGNISISPFDPKMTNPNSYNYRLGTQLLEITSPIIDPKIPCRFKTIDLDESGYVLKPNRLYLASTLEKIGSQKYVTQLIGRSSLGRLGLFLQVTAPLGHVGCYHNWTLELKAVQPLRIYPKMKIGQVTFWHLSGKKYTTYETGKYNHHSKPQISLFYQNRELE